MINYTSTDVIVAPDGKWLNYRMPLPDYEKYYLEVIFNDATSGNRGLGVGLPDITIPKYTFYMFDGTTRTYNTPVEPPWNLGVTCVRGMLELDLQHTPDYVNMQIMRSAGQEYPTSDDATIRLIGETNNVQTVLGTVNVYNASQIPGMSNVPYVLYT